MNGQGKPLTDWIGSKELREDVFNLAPALGVSALLDRDAASLQVGSPLPALWHWFYFLPQVPTSRIGHDGHPERGGFMPPVDLPRRMFAGSRMEFIKPAILGRAARREGEVLNVLEKSGKSGKLVFVTVEYRIYQDDTLCIKEEQDIVYKEAGGRIPAPVPLDAWAPLPSGSWSQIVEPSEVFLFRFSALTFNAHRIHYDRRYAMDEEGYPGLVVHGPLTALMLAELAARGSARRISAFSFQGRAPLFDLHPFRLVGLPRDDKVMLEAQGPAGETSLTATAMLD
ncbi:MAG: acyl-CoA dehydrogenase [Gammaproteobacteria bacterium]|nr:acyl-CoA dehydrogenase [Gammaproteobacteria bacterium]